MPSVRMRRSSRVLKARVLRSGRKLLMGSHEKRKNTRDGDNKCVGILDSKVSGGGNFSDHLEDADQAKVDNPVMELAEERNKEVSAQVGLREDKIVDKRWGIVYRRKRKRTDSITTGWSEDKRFGIKYYRRRLRKTIDSNEPLVVAGDFQFDRTVRRRRALFVVNESSYHCSFWVASMLTSILRYMTRVRIRTQSLSAFLFTEPMFSAFASHGLRFLEDMNTTNKTGCCIIWEPRSWIPIFSMDFSLIPSTFALMHLNMSLRCVYSACVFMFHSLDIDRDGEKVTDDSDKQSFQVFSGSDLSDNISFTSQISTGIDLSRNDEVVSSNAGDNRDFLPPAVGQHKYALRSVRLRNSRSIQKRRTSIRRISGRPASAIRAQKLGGSLASEILKMRNSAGQFSVTPTRLLRSSIKKSSPSKAKELNSSMGRLMRVVSSNCCSANLLIIEADKCYREEGITIALELLDSRQWVLVITNNGEKRCNLTAEKTMRPSNSNRFNHATIWMVDSGRKLEFVDKQDWLIFKELYKKCFERNLQDSESSDIPVPGVRVIPKSLSNDYVPYVRPHTYITVKHDELARALTKKSAVYDMDSDDEDWLEKFNDNLDEFITPERFELVIDALEKSYQCNPKEQAINDSFMHLERKEVIDAIRAHWIKKRKQNHSALVRIFQLYQPRRSQVIPKPTLRKKRTIKRQTSHVGRGKQGTLLQATMAVVEQTRPMEQRYNEQKLRQAKAFAERSEELAILKRHRAQKLMANADLATYKAMMALKIAELAQIAEGSSNFASFLS